MGIHVYIAGWQMNSVFCKFKTFAFFMLFTWQNLFSFLGARTVQQAMFLSRWSAKLTMLAGLIIIFLLFDETGCHWGRRPAVATSPESVDILVLLLVIKKSKPQLSKLFMSITALWECENSSKACFHAPRWRTLKHISHNHNLRQSALLCIQIPVPFQRFVIYEYF